MEIKHILQKPYTEEQRIDFIVTYNHNQGLTINETETELQALGLDNEELLEQTKQDKLNENTYLANQNLEHEIKIPVTDEQIECVFIYNDKTESNLNSASVMIIAGVIEKKQWTDEQGITVQLSAEDIANIGTRFNMHADKIWKLWGEYKEQIEACTTVEEVNAIDLNYEINE